MWGLLSLQPVFNVKCWISSFSDHVLAREHPAAKCKLCSVALAISIRLWGCILGGCPQSDPLHTWPPPRSSPTGPGRCHCKVLRVSVFPLRYKNVSWWGWKGYLCSALQTGSVASGQKNLSPRGQLLPSPLLVTYLMNSFFSNSIQQSGPGQVKEVLYCIANNHVCSSVTTMWKTYLPN